MVRKLRPRAVGRVGDWWAVAPVVTSSKAHVPAPFHSPRHPCSSRTHSPSREPPVLPTPCPSQHLASLALWPDFGIWGSINSSSKPLPLPTIPHPATRPPHLLHRRRQGLEVRHIQV